MIRGGATVLFFRTGSRVRVLAAVHAELFVAAVLTHLRSQSAAWLRHRGRGGSSRDAGETGPGRRLRLALRSKTANPLLEVVKREGWSRRNHKTVKSRIRHLTKRECLVEFPVHSAAYCFVEGERVAVGIDLVSRKTGGQRKRSRRTSSIRQLRLP